MADSTPTVPDSEDLDSEHGFPCPICGEELQAAVKKCRHCGEWIERDCEVCHTPLRGIYAARGICVECSAARNVPAPIEPSYPPVVSSKSKGVATLLSLFLGGLGAHRFYLGRPLSGIMYLVFFWTLIPALLAFAEVFRLGLMGEDEFHRKYD